MLNNMGRYVTGVVANMGRWITRVASLHDKVDNRGC